MYDKVLDILCNCHNMTCCCDTCSVMCRNPCVPLPSQVESLVESGYGKRLMVREMCYFLGCNMIMPAYNISEGEHMFYREVELLDTYSSGVQCTFLTQHGLCEIHKMKPLEGKITISCKSQKWEQNNILLKKLEEYIITSNIRYAFEYLWYCKEGQDILSKYSSYVTGVGVNGVNGENKTKFKKEENSP